MAVGLTFLVVACGSSGPPSPSTPPSAGVTTITGHEQIGWNQSTIGIDAGSLKFVAYVDDVRLELSSAACGAPSSDGVTCQSLLPAMTAGRHTIALAAYLVSNHGIVEGPRSSPIIVMVEADTTGGVVTSSSAGHTPPAAAGSAQGPVDCRLAINSVGTVYLSESTGRIRSWTADGKESALDWQTTDGELVVRGMASHPAYEQNQWIYLLLTDVAAAPPPRRITIVRYRELSGVLGEAAVIFQSTTGLPLVRPILRFGPDGRLYMILLGDPDAESLTTPRPFVMRLEDDGRVPADNPRGSPFLDLTARSPTAVAWDAAQRMWVVGRSPVAQGFSPAALLLRTIDSSTTWNLTQTAPVAMAVAPPEDRPLLWAVEQDGRIAATTLSTRAAVQEIRSGTDEHIGDAIVTSDSVLACEGNPSELRRYSLRGRR